MRSLHLNFLSLCISCKGLFHKIERAVPELFPSLHFQVFYCLCEQQGPACVHQLGAGIVCSDTAWAPLPPLALSAFPWVFPTAAVPALYPRAQRILSPVLFSLCFGEQLWDLSKPPDRATAPACSLPGFQSHKLPFTLLGWLSDVVSQLLTEQTVVSVLSMLYFKFCTFKAE